MDNAEKIAELQSKLIELRARKKEIGAIVIKMIRPVPRCRQCGRKMRIDMYESRLRGISAYGYHGNGHFCSRKCGFAFAVALLDQE